MKERVKLSYQGVADECERLTHEGTRPTMELVRFALGGSPNTITAHMNAWWKTHAARLREKGLQAPAPATAEDQLVDALLRQVIQHAKEAATQEAELKLKAHRDAATQEVVTAQKAQRDADIALAERADRIKALEASVIRGEQERRALSEQLQARTLELQLERDRVAATTERLRSETSALEHEKAERRREDQAAQAARKEVEAQRDADRKLWLTEIDRARTDATQAVKREEKALAALEAARADLRSTSEARAQQDVRLEQASAQVKELGERAARLAGELEEQRQAGTKRESELANRLVAAEAALAAIQAERSSQSQLRSKPTGVATKKPVRKTPKQHKDR